MFHVTFGRRGALLALLFMLGMGMQAAARAEITLRIGYQKSSTLMSIVKLQGTLEQRLAQKDI